MRLYRLCDVIKTSQENFFGKLLILARPRETHLHTASFFKLTKR